MIVEACCNFILNGENVKEEGIFRLPGNHLEVKKLQESYDKGDRPIFDRLNYLVKQICIDYILYLPLNSYNYYIFNVYLYN